MISSCIHYDTCRNPVQQCNSKCERQRCDDREFGKYQTFKAGRGESIAELTRYGWKTEWSKWYQNDSDFDQIGCKVID